VSISCFHVQKSRLFRVSTFKNRVFYSQKAVPVKMDIREAHHHTLRTQAWITTLDQSPRLRTPTYSLPFTIQSPRLRTPTYSMPFTMASNSSSQPKSVSDAISIVDIDAEMTDMSSSPPAPSSQASSTQGRLTPQPPKALSPLPTSELDSPSPLPTSGLDYSVWTAERYALWPGLVAAPDGTRERAWWWQYGYRMKDERSAKIKWVCVRCFKRQRSATPLYTFIASTGIAITKHLKGHSIRVSCASLLTH